MDSYGYKHTLTICNTYYFSTATTVTERPLILCYAYPASLVMVFAWQTEKIKDLNTFVSTQYNIIS